MEHALIQAFLISLELPPAIAITPAKAGVTTKNIPWHPVSPVQTRHPL
jgi:hypothetical protein